MAALISPFGVSGTMVSVETDDERPRGTSRVTARFFFCGPTDRCSLVFLAVWFK